jgi:hypothetical protein
MPTTPTGRPRLTKDLLFATALRIADDHGLGAQQRSRPPARAIAASERGDRRIAEWYMAHPGCSDSPVVVTVS